MNRQLDMHRDPGTADGEATDPVCGMTVNRDDARVRGLHVEHEGSEYFFCGKGCKLEFQDDPARYLAPDYQPHM